MMRGHISFSPALMPKVLDGSKSMTRRLISEADRVGYPNSEIARASPGGFETSGRIAFAWHSPYASRLWVKERLERRDDRIIYAADGRLVPAPKAIVYAGNGAVRRDGLGLWWPWKPRVLGAMYCPRWASRCSIDLLEVRVQRLQEISEEDAISEGIGALSHRRDGHALYGIQSVTDSDWLSARDAFAQLWDSINDKPGTTWADNPWVWALRFKRVRSLTEGG